MLQVRATGGGRLSRKGANFPWGLGDCNGETFSRQRPEVVSYTGMNLFLSQKPGIRILAENGVQVVGSLLPIKEEQATLHQFAQTSFQFFLRLEWAHHLDHLVIHL